MAERLYTDPRLVRFYDLDNGWGADDRAVMRLAEGAGSLLDLGCGTGRLAAALGGVREVTGVDPAEAMLAVARSRPGGDAVRWVLADAREVRLGRRFDLVTMTGHAFQCLLTAEDRAAVLATVAAHLAPGGRFVFDTRNPAREAWRDWVPEAGTWAVEDPELGAVEAWNTAVRDPETGIVTYGTHYRVAATGEVIEAEARLAFPSRAEVAVAIAAAGLSVEAWWGDWEGAPWTEDAPEIIPLGRLT